MSSFTIDKLREAQRQLMGFGPAQFGALNIQVTKSAVSKEIDWSKVRSPSRALRRQKKRPLPRKEVPGAFRYGDTVVMHPDLFAKLQDYLRSAK